MPAEARRRLPPELIIALDVVRVVAALLVVMQHVGPYHFAFLGPLNRLGQEAVMIFFLLSGFVIYANEHNRLHDLKGYYLRRMRRIYPTFLIALFVTALIAYANGTLARDFSWWELWGNLAALQDISALKPGVIVSPFLGNDPLWSLSHEIFFYAVFPVVIFLATVKIILQLGDRNRLRHELWNIYFCTQSLATCCGILSDMVGRRRNRACLFERRSKLARLLARGRVYFGNGCTFSDHSPLGRI